MQAQRKRSGASRNSPGRSVVSTARPPPKQIPVQAITFSHRNQAKSTHQSQEQMITARGGQQVVGMSSSTAVVPIQNQQTRNQQYAFMTLQPARAEISNLPSKRNSGFPIAPSRPNNHGKSQKDSQVSPNKISVENVDEASTKAKLQIDNMHVERSKLLSHMQQAAGSHKLTKAQKTGANDSRQMSKRKISNHQRSSQRQHASTVKQPLVSLYAKMQGANDYQQSGDHLEPQSLSNKRMTVTPAQIESNFSSIKKSAGKNSSATDRAKEIRVRKFRPFTASTRKQQLSLPQGDGSISGIATSTPILQSERQTHLESSNFDSSGLPPMHPEEEGGRPQQSVGEIASGVKSIDMLAASVQNYNLQTITTVEAAAALASESPYPSCNNHQLVHQQSSRQQLPSTQKKPPRPTNNTAADSATMIINQTYHQHPQEQSQELHHRQTNSNQNLAPVNPNQLREKTRKIPSSYQTNQTNGASSGGVQAANPAEKDYFMLDDQNRVILVSTTGHHANTSAATGQNQGHQQYQRVTHSKSGARDYARGLQPKSQTVLIPSTGQSGVCKNQQQSQGNKIIEQLTGKSSAKRKPSKATKALKENEVLCVGGPPPQDFQAFAVNQAQFENRNSNTNMKTAGVSTRHSTQVPQCFSTTTSTYLPLAASGATVIQDPQTGAIYQVDQNNLNYLMQPQGQYPPHMNPHRQLVHNRPSAIANQATHQQYFSNPPTQGQQSIPHQVQLTQNLEQHHQVQQKSHSQSRSRPRSSAPTANVHKKRLHNASRDMPRGGHKQQLQENGQEKVRQQYLNDNLMQTGHVIVTSMTGTPIGGVDLSQPQIISQGGGQQFQPTAQAPMILAYPTSQQQQHHHQQHQQQQHQHQQKSSGSGKVQNSVGRGSLCIQGLVHPDLVQFQAAPAQQQNHSSQPPNRRKDNFANTQQSTFFGKRKNRDRDSKLGIQGSVTQGGKQPTTQQQVPQCGTKVAISNPQHFLTTQEGIVSGSGRPQTGKQTFHKTTASLTVNPNMPVQGVQQSVQYGGTPLEAEINLRNAGNQHNNHERMSFDNRTKDSAKGSSQLVTESCMTSLGGQTIVHQKNLSSVRSGTLFNYSNSIVADQDGQDLSIHKQLSNSDKTKVVFTASASPGTKMQIRSRKGFSSILGGNGNGSNSGGAGGSGLQMLPSTPKTFKRTKRVLFARRMNFMDRPLLVITFQGVLGDFIKKQHTGLKDVHVGPNPATQPTTAKEKKAFAREEEVVNMRAGVVEGLKYLCQLFQLIIFSRETVEDSWFDRHGAQTPASEIQTKAILNWIQGNPEIKLDGFYASQLSAKQQTMTDDYSQIFMDFGLNSEHKVKERVLFVNSISSDFICNQRLPACANISPRGKKPTAAQLGISNARGLQDIDPHGYFMFDLSCQPAQPLVMGLPITLEIKQSGKKAGTRSSSIVETTEDSLVQQQSQSQSQRQDQSVNQRHMASTLLVPNLRTQNVKNQTNFSHVTKTLMFLAFLGQKKTQIKPLHKEISINDFTTAIEELEAEFGSIKERQVKLSHKRLLIMSAGSSHQQLGRGQSEVTSSAIQGLQKNQNQQRKNRQLTGQQRDAESPASDLSQRQNGSRGRGAFLNGKQTQSFKVQGTTSSRTAATTNIGNENSSFYSGNHQNQLRSASLNSEKWAQGTQEGGANHQLLTNESYPNVHQQSEHSPKETTTPGVQKEVSIDLTDGTFFANLSWSKGIDYLHAKPLGDQKKYLGMQAAQSDVVWRYYKRQAQERLQLRQMYETRMQATEQLIKKTLANDTIMANQQKNIDEIFKILRQRDLVGNPFGFTMGRNYRFFSNLKVQMRRKLTKELDQWKARNEAVAASKAATKDSTKTAPVAEQPAASTSTQASSTTGIVNPGGENSTTANQDQASRLLALMQSQQVLHQQHTEALEELLERNRLVNRFVVVGLDAPYQK